MAHGPAVHRSPWRFDWLSRNVFPHAPAWLLDLVVPVRIIGTTLDDTDGRVYGADGFAQLAPASGNFAAFVFRANGVHVEVLHVDAWARDQNSLLELPGFDLQVGTGPRAGWPGLDVALSSTSMSGLYGSRSKGVALLDSGLTSALPSGELVILPKQGRPSPFARDSVRIRIEPDQELIVVHTLTPVGAPANVDFFATIYWVEVTA